MLIRAMVLVTAITFGAPAEADEPLEMWSPFQQDMSAPYRVFPTTNINTLLVLGTADGRLYQVHPGIGENALEGVQTLNARDLSPDGEPKTPNRFTLYPTKNIFSFLLVDQINGKFWRIQWNYDENKRFIRWLDLLQ